MRDEPERDDTDAVRAYWELVWRWRLGLMGLPAALAALVVIVVLALPRTYTVTAAFVPERPSGAIGRLGAVAAQLGIVVPGSPTLQSPQLYVELLGSGPVLRSLVRGRFEVAQPRPFTGTLIEYFGIRAADSLRRVDLAVRRLRRELAVTASSRTGVVRVTTRQRSPHLAAEILRRTLAAVDTFNVSARQAAAGGERAFVEGRLVVARAELRAAEDSLERFLEHNRQFRASARLTFAHDRLQREVAVRQEVVGTLTTVLEQARVEEVRATPTVTILEVPIVPGVPDSRFVALKGFATWVLGVLLGLAGLLTWLRIREAGQRLGASSPGGPSEADGRLG